MFNVTKPDKEYKTVQLVNRINCYHGKEVTRFLAVSEKYPLVRLNLKNDSHSKFVVVTDSYCDLYDRNGCYLISSFVTQTRNTISRFANESQRSSGMVKCQGDLVFEYNKSRGLFLYSIVRALFSMYPELDNTMHDSSSSLEETVKKFIETVPHEKRRDVSEIHAFLQRPQSLIQQQGARSSTPIMVSRIKNNSNNAASEQRPNSRGKLKVSFADSKSVSSRSNNSRGTSRGSAQRSTPEKKQASVKIEHAINNKDVIKVSDRLNRVRSKITNDRKERRARMNDLLGIAKPKSKTLQSEAGELN